MTTTYNASSCGNLDRLVSSFQVASDKWVTFDWNGTLKQCVSNLSQTIRAQEQQGAVQHQLAETTKVLEQDIKIVEQEAQTLASSHGESSGVKSMAKTVENLVRDCRTTVKAYQDEMDNLTRRCKSSEQSYSSLSQSLAELPDPSTAIFASLQQLKMNKDLVSQVQSYQKEIAQLKESHKKQMDLHNGEREELLKLRREVSAYKVNFRSFREQGSTIRKLQAKIAELQKGGKEELPEKVEKAREIAIPFKSCIKDHYSSDQESQSSSAPSDQDSLSSTTPMDQESHASSPSDQETQSFDRQSLFSKHEGRSQTVQRFKPSDETKWNRRFKEFLEFVKEHGHGAVPISYQRSPQLASWVKRQRHQYKLATLTTERLNLLNSVGFVWDSHEVTWKEKFDALKQYRGVHGHCNVPAKYSERGLGSWVRCQRRLYKLHLEGKASPINQERIEQLKKLGFEWEIRNVAPKNVAVKD